MKELIYLDTSFLHSFIAQIFGGLPSNVTNESQESRTQTNTDSKQFEKSSEMQTNLNALLAKGGTKIARKRTSGESFSLAQLEAGKEIISKQLHDNALDDLISYLSENDLLKDENSIEVGKYVLKHSTFSVVDIDQLRSFTKKEFQTLMKISSTPGKGKTVIPPNFQTMIDFISLLIPSDAFFKQQGIIAPVKKDYLREQSKELIFKYGDNTKITILGKVTRKFEGASSAPEEVKSFGDFNNTIYAVAKELLIHFGIVGEGDYILSPIAIFFESI